MLTIKLRSFIFIILLQYLTNGLQKSGNKVGEVKVVMQDDQPIICTQPIVRSNSVIELGKCGKYLYTIPLLIGTPAQRINIALSTLETRFLFIVQNDQLQGFHSVNSSIQSAKSTSVQINSSFKPKQKQNVGFLTYKELEIVYLNSSEGITKDIFFLNSSYNIKQSTQSSKVFGILGLGPSPTKYNLFYDAYSKGLLQTAMFTLSLNNNKPSFLYYNQIAQEIISNSTFVPIITNDSYQISIKQFDINGNQVSDVNGAPLFALLDSSAPYFIISQKLYSFIVENYFNSCYQEEVILCSCQADSWPTFTLKLQSIDIQLAPENYLSSQGDGRCTFNFQSNQDINDQTIVLGSSLFESYNVTFDQVGGKIGLQKTLIKRSIELTIIDSTFFKVSVSIILALVIAFFILSIVMLWQFRVVKNNNKYSRFTQISLSSRFLDN